MWRIPRVRLGIFFFTLKSKTPFILLTNVVYKFSCLGDPSISYIGKTERHIATRMDEHLDRRAEKSAVTSHINSCVSCATHGVSYDNFSILRKCDTPYSTSIHEAFLIRRYKPLLNVQTPNQGQCVLLKIFWLWLFQGSWLPGFQVVCMCSYDCYMLDVLHRLNM